MDKQDKQLADRLRKQGLNVETPKGFKERLIEAWNELVPVRLIKWIIGKVKGGL